MPVRAPRERRPALYHVGAPSVVDRRFEAAIFDWDAAGPHRTLTQEIRRLVEELSLQGFDVGVISRRRLGAIDTRLSARPAGPGRLYLLVNRCSELFEVGREGPKFLGLRSAPDDRRAGEADFGSSILEELWRDGIGPQDVLLVRDASVVAVLDAQLRRRTQGELPRLAADPEWIVTVDGFHRTLERVHEAQLTLADGHIGTAGAPLVGDSITSPRVLAAGVYDDEGAESHLLSCPIWSRLDGDGSPPQRLARALDLRTGLLFEPDAVVLTADLPACVRVGEVEPVVVPASGAVRMARRGASREEV